MTSFNTFVNDFVVDVVSVTDDNPYEYRTPWKILYYELKITYKPTEMTMMMNYQTFPRQGEEPLCKTAVVKEIHKIAHDYLNGEWKLKTDYDGVKWYDTKLPGYSDVSPRTYRYWGNFTKRVQTIMADDFDTFVKS